MSTDLWHTLIAAWLTGMVMFCCGLRIGWLIANRNKYKDSGRLDWLEETRSEIDTEGPGIVIYGGKDERGQLGAGLSQGSYRRLRPAIDAAMRNSNR